MAAQQEAVGSEQSDPFNTRWDWRSGAISGLLAAVVMGLGITLTQQATLQVAIAGLYGQAGNLLVGWIAHVVHGTLFGMLFALVLAEPGLYHLTDWPRKTALAGAVYGVVLAVGAAGIVMPMWIGILGGPAPETIPALSAPMLVWHLLYGTVLGTLYPYVEDR
jgi:hypothetical protein